MFSDTRVKHGTDTAREAVSVNGSVLGLHEDKKTLIHSTSNTPTKTYFQHQLILFVFDKFLVFQIFAANHDMP